MPTDNIITEARARIIWGEEPDSVRAFLISNGMPATDADAALKNFAHERNAEIRKIGIRDAVIGGALLAGAGIAYYYLSKSSFMHNPSGGRRHGYGYLYIYVIMVALYGLWRLIKSIPHLARPKSEHGSIPDLSE